ncbi:MAG: hypothetical protein JKY26_17455 [Pseudomonas sp.]|nr:hypothetical protein [Pseudomonas sp.]
MIDEDLAGFLEDFDDGGEIDGQPFLAVSEMPDEIRALAGINSQSTYHEILIITAVAKQLGITPNRNVRVRGIDYRVRDVRKIDDGALSLASLTEL